MINPAMDKASLIFIRNGVGNAILKLSEPYRVKTLQSTAYSISLLLKSKNLTEAAREVTLAWLETDKVYASSGKILANQAEETE